MNYETVIGLEVHAQLNTKSKIFCSCSTSFGAKPNENTCPVCLGLPGVLPVLNRQVVHNALKAALALNCEIQKRSIWARKNYFYPDLPKGYQISQYEDPIALKGTLQIRVNDQTKHIGITRIHMEEDAGKLLHDYGSSQYSHVDLNRAGVPLIEIVSEPDIRSAQEASEYMKQLRSILRYTGVCDGNLEEGSLRCDANVSIRPMGSSTLGTKVEIKNINSFKFVEKAIEYEVKRQKACLANNESIVQETRLYDPHKDMTESMRSKEDAHDYRYFPDPDLVPLIIDDDWKKQAQQEIPELPQSRQERFIHTYELSEYDASFLTVEKDIADFFEETLHQYNQPKKISNWIMTELMRELNQSNKEISQAPITAQQLAALIQLIDEGHISGKMGKKIFVEMFQTGKDPEAIIQEQNLSQVSDTGAIETVIAAIMNQNPGQVEQYRAGKTKVFGFFVGQVMKEMKGQANPQVVNDILKKKLDQ